MTGEIYGHGKTNFTVIKIYNLHKINYVLGVPKENIYTAVSRRKTFKRKQFKLYIICNSVLVER